MMMASSGRSNQRDAQRLFVWVAAFGHKTLMLHACHRHSCCGVRECMCTHAGTAVDVVFQVGNKQTRRCGRDRCARNRSEPLLASPCLHAYEGVT